MLQSAHLPPARDRFDPPAPAASRTARPHTGRDRRAGRVLRTVRVAALGAGLALAVTVAPAASASPLALRAGLPVAQLPPSVAVASAGASGLEDASGLLSAGDARAVESAIAEVSEQAGIDLHVRFTSGLGSTEEFDAALEEYTSGLGQRDAVLAVDPELRYGRFVAHQSSGLADDTQRIWEERIVPELSSGSLDSGALRAAAAGVLEADLGEGGSQGDGGGAGLLWLLPVGAAVAGGVWFVQRRKRRSDGRDGGLNDGAGSAAPPQETVLSAEEIEQQRQNAGSLLVAADDAVRSSRQDVEFARAQYGDAAVETFQADLMTAKQQVTRAFELQQKLDDHVPDTPEEQSAWLREIQRLCMTVDATLESHRTEFEELRQLERRAPEELLRLRVDEQRTRGRIGAAAAVFERLSRRFSDEALAHVADNDEQAAGRLDFALEQLAEAEREIASSGAGAAALRLHAAEEAIGQAGELLDAVEAAEPELDKATAALREAVGTTERDLAQVRSLAQTRQAPELAAATAAVEHELQRVRTEIQDGAHDPVALLRRLEAAHAELDAPLAGLRSQQDQQARAAEQVQSAIYSAQLRLRSASEFVGVRRGGVGAAARTRLAEAERHLDEAIRLRGADPATALNHANRALSLAEQASETAQQDVAGFDPFGRGPMGRGGYRRGGDGMGMLGGVLLGGILSDMMHDGHDRGGMWGGGGFGGFSGGGGGFGGGGGGFGGGGGGFGGGGGGSF
ncbi:TPM domain-containing protein [Zhihengliuella alba]|uniref:TPM domain-containing protein n=1 Tax=Zhihengliuella alba TaxID=547018 RepID=A0ABP7CUW3_9MICC